MHKYDYSRSWLVAQRKSTEIALEDAMIAYRRAETMGGDIKPARLAAVAALSLGAMIFVGPLALIGITVPSMVGAFTEGLSHGVDVTWHSARKLSLEMGRTIDRGLPPEHPAWDGVYEQLMAMRGLVDVIRKGTPKI